eukprot:jgi/Ulvmu1/1132/UM107_0005.1
MSGQLLGTSSQYSAAASARHLTHKQQLGLSGLVCLIFLEVAGGPFGTEDAVKAAGPLLAILGFLLLPFVWSIPEALICAELATAFPENSGYVMWVESAFGPFFGFLEGLFSWVSGVTDNTLYPIMFVKYLEIFIPGLVGHWTSKISALVIALAMTGLNYSGLDVVGRSSEVVVVAVVLPFIALAVLALPKMDVSHWRGTKPVADIQWIDYLNVMFWNLNSWDCISTLAGEVRNPARLFPRALFFAVQLVVAMYLLPLLVGVAVTDDVYGDWSVGYYGHVAQQVGGPALAAAVTFAAVVSQVGMFEAEMSSDSYQVLGMSERGYLPASFARRSRFGTPAVGILLSSVGIFTMLTFSFLEIVEMLNVVYSMGELLEFAAFVWLRVSQPDLKRPFKVPLPAWALTLMLLPASALLLTVILLPFIMGQTHVVLYTLGVALLGVSLYAALQLMRRCRVVHFEPSDALASDHWRPEGLAAALLAFPAFITGLALVAFTPLDAVLAAALAAAAALIAAGALTFVVVVLLRREVLVNTAVAAAGGVDGGGGAAAAGSHGLSSIPEAPGPGEQPLMQAFLRDAIVNVESLASLQRAGGGTSDGISGSSSARGSDDGDAGGGNGADAHTHAAPTDRTGLLDVHSRNRNDRP